MTRRSDRMADAADEHETAAPPIRNRRVALLVVALILAIGVTALLVATRPRTMQKFCTAEGRGGPNPGQMYGRDPKQDCKVVDEDGNVLPPEYQ